MLREVGERVEEQTLPVWRSTSREFEDSCNLGTSERRDEASCSIRHLPSQAQKRFDILKHTLCKLRRGLNAF